MIALIRKRLVYQRKKDGKVYEVIQPLDNANTPPEELKPLLNLLQHRGYITNQNIRETMGLDRKAALRFSERMVSLGWLEREGDGRDARYVSFSNKY